MAGHALDKNRAPIVDAEYGWAVYWCDHGCVHVAMDRVTFTLTIDEFAALRSLLARVRPRLDDGVTGPVRHAH